MDLCNLRGRFFITYVGFTLFFTSLILTVVYYYIPSDNRITKGTCVTDYCELEYKTCWKRRCTGTLNRRVCRKYEDTCTIIRAQYYLIDDPNYIKKEKVSQCIENEHIDCYYIEGDFDSLKNNKSDIMTGEIVLVVMFTIFSFLFMVCCCAFGSCYWDKFRNEDVPGLISAIKSKIQPSMEVELPRRDV